MMQHFSRLVVVGGVLALAGCDALSLFLPNTVTVSLINNGTLPVDGQLFYDSDESALDLLNDISALDNFIREFGDEIQFDLAGGETMTFTRSCNDLQVIFIDDANVRLAGIVTSDDNTDPIREGQDFVCGSTITYTFESNDLGLGLSIITDVGLGVLP